MSRDIISVWHMLNDFVFKTVLQKMLIIWLNIGTLKFERLLLAQLLPLCLFRLLCVNEMTVHAIFE